MRLAIAATLVAAAGGALLAAAPASALPCPQGTRYQYVYGSVGTCLPYTPPCPAWDCFPPPQ